jgi:hypothetical protein
MQHGPLETRSIASVIDLGLACSTLTNFARLRSLLAATSERDLAGVKDPNAISFCAMRAALLRNQMSTFEATGSPSE